METLESLGRQIEGAKDLKSVVRSMKAISSSNIEQYDQAVNALADYYSTVALGLTELLSKSKNSIELSAFKNKKKVERAVIIIFGSDQGLVGQYNNNLVDDVNKFLKSYPIDKEIWAIGERVKSILEEYKYNVTRTFLVPTSVKAITSLVSNLLIETHKKIEGGEYPEINLFHNKPDKNSGYVSSKQRLLPLDNEWKQSLETFHWPTKKRPDILGDQNETLLSLIREYLFVSLYKICAESLASENASRLQAMERADKNIDDMLESLNQSYHRERQTSIDEELFDIISGFESQ